MCTKYDDIYFKTILDSSSIQRQFCFKPIPDISYFSNKISKKNYLFWVTIINTLKKKKQNKIYFNSKAPPQVNKKGKQLFTQFQQSLNLIL